MNRVDELEVALLEALRLNAHYAKLLNEYDGGKRLWFTSTDGWIKRLRETGTLKE